MALTFEESLFKKLSTTSAISNLCSTRIYPRYAQQTTVTPFVVYQKISGNRYHFLNGDTGEMDPVFQIDIYGTTYTSARGLADKIRLTLQNFSGLLYADGVTVKAVLMENELDEFEEETKLYRVMQEYRFFYQESVT